MKLSEITPIQILGGVLVVNTVLAGGATQLTDLFGAAMANHILSVCILGSGICGGFIMNMGGLGTQARNVVAGGASIAVGPNANLSLATLAMDPAQNKIDAAPGAAAAVAAIAKAAAVILFAFIVAGLMFAPPAHAQTKLQSDIDAAVSKAVARLTTATQAAAATGKAAQTSQGLEAIMSAISKPFQDLADFIAADATGAAALATVVPGLQDTNGKACWTKMQNAGAVFQAHPVPLTLKVMTDFESLRLLQMTANDLCSYTPCTVVFSDGANLAVSVASAVGGALTSNAVPSLTQLCARIPQLSPMLPQAVTGLAPQSVSQATPTTVTTPAPPDSAAPAPPSK